MNLAVFFKKKQIDSNRSIFRLLIIPYVVLLLFFVTFMSYMFQNAKSKLKDEILVANTNTYHVISKSLESLKYSLDLYVQQLAKDEHLLSASRKSEWTGSDVYSDIYNFNYKVNHSQMPYNAIKGVSVYYPSSGNIVVDSGILKASREYKNYYFANHMSGDMSYQSWKSFMLEKNYSFELYRAVNGEIIYLHTVTDGNAVQAVLMLTINAEAFQNLSRNMDAGNGIVIHNHCGEAIYSSVPQLIPPPAGVLAAEQKPDFDKTLDTVKVGDMSYVVFRGQSAPLLGLSYYIVETEIFKSAEHLTVFFCIMAIVFILLAIALSVYFAKLNYKPIYEIAHTLRNLGNNSPDNKNEYKFIKTSIHSLSEQNKRNATIINKHNKLVFNLNLKNYLAGLKSFPKRPSELFSIYQVDFSYANYIVALIIINNVDESVWDLSLGDDELIFSAVDNLFMDFSSVDFNNLYVQIDEYTALLLIGTNLTDRQTIRQAVEKAFWDEHSYSLENVGIDFAAHISDVFSDINDIRQAYTQVKEFHYTNNAIISMYREPDQNGIHDYSIFEKTERLLEKALENSDSKSAEQVLNDLFAEHLSEAPLSFRTFAKIRLLSVFSGMVKFLEPPEVQKYLKLIDNIDSKGVSCKGFIELANLFCQANQNNLEDSRLSNAITKYVKEHFSDSSLNVNTLSYIFDKTPSYLSSIFKSETGKMLNRYIAETRIHNAELLLLSDQKIDLIAEQCGFSDTTTFRRSFKRYLGMTPTEYQKSYKTKENKS